MITGFAAMTGGVRANVPPADWFFQPPDLARPQLSPDGRRLAALSRHDPRHVALATIDLESGKADLLIKESAVTVTDFGWKADDLILLVLTDDRGISSLHTLDLNKRKTRRLEHVERGGIRGILSLVPEDSVSVLYRSGTGTLYRVDLRTGRAQPVERLVGGIDHWAIDGAGNVWAGVGHFGGKWTFVWRSSPEAPWQQTEAGCGKGPKLFPLGVSAQRHCVVVLERQPGRTDRMSWFDLRTGSIEAIFQHDSADVTGMGAWGFYREPAAAVFRTDREERHAFHAEAADCYRLLRATLPDSDAACISFSRDNRRVIVDASNECDPGTYYLLDRATGRLEVIGSSRPGLASQTFVAGRAFEFKARDGTPLTGRITLPPGVVRPPVLVQLGPELVGMRTPNAFDARTQFLANRGIASVRIHARGTAGFGREFLRAGDLKINTAVVDDIEDGIAAVADRIDAKRAGILGESWGGLTALHAAARGGFRVLVNFNAPTAVRHADLESLVPSDRSYDELIAMLGGRSAANAYVDSLDPLGAAARLRIPSFHYYVRGSAGHEIAASARALREVLEKTSAPFHFHADAADRPDLNPAELTRARYDALATFLAKHL